MTRGSNVPSPHRTGLSLTERSRPFARAFPRNSLGGLSPPASSIPAVKNLIQDQAPLDTHVDFSRHV